LGGQGAIKPLGRDWWCQALLNEDVQALQDSDDGQAQRPVLVLEHDHRKEVRFAFDDLARVSGKAILRGMCFGHLTIS
jgi:hypothetical protein